jgi:glycosyltransferase involved in cell wall biosynthesis
MPNRGGNKLKRTDKMINNEVSQNNKPLVSVIIPFLNREKFLQQAIESVLSQSYDNWELILVDDGSTDRSAEISRNFVEKYPAKIRLLAHLGNAWRGAGATRNMGIRNAHGEYIVFLDSDDVFFPETIERELKAFEANPTADAVCGTLQYWYSWSAEIKKSEQDFKVNLGLKLEELYEPPFLLVHNLRSGGRKPGITTLMLKREFVNLIGAFEENFNRIGEDQVFWAKVSLNGRIYVMDACLAKYRQHSDSSCSVSIRENRYIPQWQFYYDWLRVYLTERKITDQEVWRVLNQAQNNTRLQGKFIKLRQIYQRVLPLRIRYWIRDQWIKFALQKNK